MIANQHVVILAGRNDRGEIVHLVQCLRCQVRPWHCGPWVTVMEMHRRQSEHAAEHRGCR